MFVQSLLDLTIQFYSFYKIESPGRSDEITTKLYHEFAPKLS